MNRARKKALIRAGVFCAAAILLLLAGMNLVDGIHRGEYQEVRGTGTEEFMQAGTVSWEGGKYRKTPGMTTILVAGIDRENDAQQGISTSRYRSGGQADFLMLLAVDHTNRKIHQLQIDRDAMTDVTILSVYGRETGTRVMQVCLSHSYGANKEENARYTLRAVRGLLNDIEIDGYYMVDYSAVNTLNEALGGVTVTVPADMTSVNPLWSQGAEITLSGGEAETFVRTRMTVGHGTNRERMSRQNAFMQGAISLLRLRLSQDASFGTQLLSMMKQKSVSGFSDQRLLEEIQQSSRYEVLPVEYLAGEYVIGENGYIEFHPEEGSAESWIMKHLYTEV